jgi:hypothetical protein
LVERCILQLDKSLFSSAAAYILGLSPDVKIKGGKEQLRVFSEALESSRVVYESLQGSNTLDEISHALADKSEKAEAFRLTFGHAWPF